MYQLSLLWDSIEILVSMYILKVLYLMLLTLEGGGHSLPVTYRLEAVASDPLLHGDHILSTVTDVQVHTHSEAQLQDKLTCPGYLRYSKGVTFFTAFTL